MPDYKIVRSDELYHYGVLGMKWGHRKAPERVTNARNTMNDAKKEYKKANRDYNKAYNKAYNYSATHPVSQWGHGHKAAESNRRWNDAIDKGKSANAAKASYKKAKQAYKSELKKPSKETVEKTAVKALDKLEDYMFFNSDKIPNSFAARQGVSAIKRGIENRDGFMNTAASALEDYRFFKD